MSIDWRALRTHADKQAGLLTRRQCLAAGMPEDMVRWRVSSRRWVRVHDGVFLTEPGRSDWLVRGMAALLWSQSGGLEADAAFCGHSAAFLWGLERDPPPGVELVVPERRRVVAMPGIVVRRSMRWENLIHETAYPWRTTLPATVLDLAAKGSEADALGNVANAVQKQLVTPTQLRQELVARGGHKHRKVLRPALVEIDDGGQSGAEILYIRDVERAHRLPWATRQSPSDRGRRRYHDNDYEEYGFLVEVDGRLGHEGWSDRVRDGQRDRRLLGADRVTTRVFWVDVAVRPCVTAGEIGAILRTRGWTGQARPCRRRGCVVRKVFGGSPESGPR